MNRILLALLLVVCSSAPAFANTTTDCFYMNGKWGPAKTIVDVWMTNSAASGFQNLGPFSVADADMVVRQAISVWNEQSGAALRLRYRGQTDVAAIGDAITIGSTPTADTFGNNALARTYNFLSPSIPTLITNSQIVFYKVDDNGPLNWETGNNNDRTQVVSPTPPIVGPRALPVLIHELGHAAFQLQHPGEAGPSPGLTCTDAGQSTVMEGVHYGLNPRVFRNVSEWDKGEAQLRYTRRSLFSQLISRQWNATSSTWNAVNTFTKNVLYRMGTATQEIGFNGPAAWVQQDAAGGGSAPVVHKEQETGFAFSSPANFPTTGIVTGPVSVASAPGGEGMMVYTAQEDFTFGSRKICFRKATDSINFGAETCVTNSFGTVLKTERDTATVAFDPRSNAFIIAWAVQGTDNITIKVEPATGSSTPSGLSVLTNTAASAPSIACRNASLGCRIVYQERTLYGAMKWVEAEVNLADGTITTGATRSGGWVLYDSPSAAFSAKEGRYRIVFGQGNGSAYSLFVTTTGTSTSNLPDLLNDGTSFISAPVLSTRFSCVGSVCSGDIFGWVTKWF